MLGLRLALIGSLFLVTSLKPALARTVTETVPSKVLVAVDRSDSMAIPDPQRSPAEKLLGTRQRQRLQGTGRHQPPCW